MKRPPLLGDGVVDVEHVGEVVAGRVGVGVGVVAAKDVDQTAVHVVGAGVTVAALHVGPRRLLHAPLARV